MWFSWRNSNWFGFRKKSLVEISRNCPNSSLCVTGIDSRRFFKEQAKDLQNITFEGFVDNIGDYLSIFDLFVFPSLHEGLGSILFDVMNFNIPIIATNVGGIPDIVFDKANGLLVEPKNSEMLYRAIIELKEDSDLAMQLSQDAFTNVDKYSSAAMAKRYIKLYQQILKNHHAELETFVRERLIKKEGV